MPIAISKDAVPVIKESLERKHEMSSNKFINQFEKGTLGDSQEAQRKSEIDKGGALFLLILEYF